MNDNLIFDLGLHDGTDTDAYLAAGFNVVAVDANPDLVTEACRRFADEIQAGHLVVIQAAIGETEWFQDFYINPTNDQWSSSDPNWAGRSLHPLTKIMVRSLPLMTLLDQYGTPHYLKIDIEGADRIALDQLRNRPELPQYLSVEDCRFGPQYIDTLASYGYSRFRLSDQTLWPKGSSGPFGEDLPGQWMSYDQMIDVYHNTVRRQNGRRLAPAETWYDIHASIS